MKIHKISKKNVAIRGGVQLLVHKMEEFREGELVSLFVHPFRPDVASVADRVREIFRGNADARPLRFPGEQGEFTKYAK